ncbi:hypothetical protein BH11PAT1_BH11PAT1_7240 [soil metagenome]
MEETTTIIGIAGAFGSGKSTAADFLASKGYTRLVLSSFLEKEAQTRGLTPITRKALQDIGNEWREAYGSDVLAKKALEYVATHNLTKVIIDGIRNTGEIEALRKHKHFLLLGIITDRNNRFERLQETKRREELNLELFNKLDYRDLGIGEKETGLQVAYCVALADRFILNNSTKEVFMEQLTIFLKKSETTV